MESIREILDNRPFFAYLAKKERARLESHTRLVSLPSGAVIFREGEISSTLYFIINGQVNFCKEITGVEEPQLISTIGPNKFFGEVAMFDGQPRSASAIANTQSKTPWLFGHFLADQTGHGLGLVLTVSTQIDTAVLPP